MQSSMECRVPGLKTIYWVPDEPKPSVYLAFEDESSRVAAWEKISALNVSGDMLISNYGIEGESFVQGLTPKTNRSYTEFLQGIIRDCRNLDVAPKAIDVKKLDPKKLGIGRNGIEYQTTQ